MWYEGGEENFIQKLITESKAYSHSCFWFTTLISKEKNVKKLKAHLSSFTPTEVKIIPMSQGNKKSRILAWTFLNHEQQKNWMKYKWK